MGSVNVRGVYLCMKYQVAQLMAQSSGGAIVNIGSTQSAFALPDGNVQYTASKHAVSGMTKQVASNYGKNGIRINSVNPGWVPTEMTEGIDKGELGAHFQKLAPMGKFVQPEDIAAAACFLLSDSAASITGAELFVDAGLTSTEAPGPFYSRELAAAAVKRDKDSTSKL